MTIRLGEFYTAENKLDEPQARCTYEGRRETCNLNVELQRFNISNQVDMTFAQQTNGNKVQNNPSNKSNTIN